MPSGRSAVVRTNCRIFTSSRCMLTVSLCVHAADGHNSEGLCGNNNGIGGDDLIPDGWDTADTNYLEPVLFSSSYMYVGYCRRHNALIVTVIAIVVLAVAAIRNKAQCPSLLRPNWSEYFVSFTCT